MRSLHRPPHPHTFSSLPLPAADAASDVNWTRVGTELAARTRSRPNLIGMYIDDFYVMMCTPEAKTFVRHGSATPLPCVPVAALEAWREFADGIEVEVFHASRLKPAN